MTHTMTQGKKEQLSQWYQWFHDGVSGKPMKAHNSAYVNGHNTGREVGINSYQISKKGPAQ